MKKRKRRRSSKLDILLDKAWKLMSEYVRRRDKGICFTCFKKDDWRNMDAGHFKHNRLDYDPRNINAQCTGCNRFRDGKLDIYALRLEEKYGHGIIQELDYLSRQVQKYTIIEVEAIITALSELVSKLP